MLFNMEMIAYFLSEFETKAELGEDELQISSFTVGNSGDAPSILKLFSEGGNVICENAANRITVFNAGIEDVINAVVRHMDFYNN